MSNTKMFLMLSLIWCKSITCVMSMEEVNRIKFENLDKHYGTSSLHAMKSIPERRVHKNIDNNHVYKEIIEKEVNEIKAHETSLINILKKYPDKKIEDNIWIQRYRDTYTDLESLLLKFSDFKDENHLKEEIESIKRLYQPRHAK